MLVKHSKRTLRTPCRKCGARDLYWAHDTEAGSTHCDECGVSGKYVLIQKNLMPHVCGEHVAYDADRAAVEADRYHGDPLALVEGESDTPKNGAELAVRETKTESGSDDPTAMLAEALRGIVGTPQIDRDQVERIARQVVSEVAFPTRTVIMRTDDTVKTIEGDTHRQLGDVITNVLAGEHVMMVGPAGTGKSTIAEQTADALGLAYYSISLSPQTPASQILGYMQAEGEYVRTLFREAYEHGGLFHFDEIDNAHPSVLAVINAALANGAMAFPDGMIKRHDDFRVVASANTYGRGANRAYVGRQAIDAATLDRFTIETIEIDEALEDALCRSTGLESEQVDRVLQFVRKLRRNAEKKNLNVILSPRATVGMCRLLQAGRSWEASVEARVRRGMDDSTWQKLNSDW